MIKRGDMPAYLTADLYEAVAIWKEYRRFGLWHGRGAADETYEYITLISALEDEMESAQSERMNRR